MPAYCSLALCRDNFGLPWFQMVSPKVHRLLQVLKEYKPAAEQDCGKSHKYNDRSVFCSA